MRGARLDEAEKVRDVVCEAVVGPRVCKCIYVFKIPKKRVREERERERDVCERRERARAHEVG